LAEFFLSLLVFGGGHERSGGRGSHVLSGVALTTLLPGVVGHAADGGERAILHDLFHAATTKQHARCEPRSACTCGALHVLVGLKGSDDAVDVEHGALSFLSTCRWGFCGRGASQLLKV